MSRGINTRWLLLWVAACTGEIGAVGDVGERPREDLPRTPIDCSEPIAPEGRLRRLTRSELANSLVDVLGEDGDVVNRLEREPQVDFLYNSYEDLWVDSSFARGYLEVTAEVAGGVANRLETFSPCAWDAEPVACTRSLVRTVGERLFRRPLDAAEIERYVDLFSTLDPDDEVPARVAVVVEAMLLSPAFLYRDETAGGSEVADSYRIASQLSYLLWATTPDEELLEDARNGRLVNEAARREQVDRMLGHPHARRGFTQFVEHLIDMPRFHEMEKDPETFDEFDDSLVDEMVEEIRRMVEHVAFDGEGTLDELMTTSTSFAGERLAELYGVASGADGRVTLDPTQRAGLLTTAGVLSFTSLPHKTRPVGRGNFVLSRFLCRELEIPPEAEIGLPEEGPDTEGLTSRERFALHIEREECAACHQHIDPLGFGLENYDAIGRWRTHDDGIPIDSSGVLVGTETADGPFEGGVELAHRLTQSPVFHDCFAKRYFQYALGRVVTTQDICALEEIQERFLDSELSLRELMVSVVSSRGFIQRGSTSEAEE